MADKVAKIVMVVFLALGALSFLMGMLGGSYDLMIYLCYIYTILGVLGALAGSVMSAMAKPDAIKGSAIGIIAMLVVLGISYGLASGEVTADYPAGTTETASKWSGTGLYMLYILTTLSVVSILYSGVARILNK